MTERDIVSLPGFKMEASNEVTIVSEKVLPSERALARIADAVGLNLSQLQLNMEKARRESSQVFCLTMTFCGIASAIILVGVSLMLADLVKVGAVTTIASVIPQAGALLLFNKEKELRKTIETYHNHIMESQRVLTMIDLAETISEPVTKDSVKEHIISTVLRIDRQANNSRR
ncbi:MAG: TRADD-N-associated membrane domain-containing protein [Beijerinckiaceae bacterium]